MATLIAENTAKAYKGRKVVEDVSLKVKSGEIVGLLGPNGAGKTTTFYMVVGIVPRDAGRIVIDEEDISLLPLHARAPRHRLPAAGSVDLPPPERVRQPDGGAGDSPRPHQRTTRRPRQRADGRVPHLPSARQPRRALSGGERRRVEIARALAATRNSFCWTNPSPGWIRFPLSTSKIIEHLRDSGPAC